MSAIAEESRRAELARIERRAGARRQVMAAETTSDMANIPLDVAREEAWHALDAYYGGAPTADSAREMAKALETMLIATRGGDDR